MKRRRLKPPVVGNDVPQINGGKAFLNGRTFWQAFNDDYNARHHIPQRRPVGHPTDYKAEYVRIVYSLRMLGATKAEVARAFGVSLSSIENWRKRIPEFAKAWTDGGDIADARVAERLFERAVGYEQESYKIYGDVKSGRELVIPYTERFPPDTSAAIFWLTNRQRRLWRSKTDHELSGPDGTPLSAPSITINTVVANKSD